MKWDPAPNFILKLLPRPLFIPLSQVLWEIHLHAGGLLRNILRSNTFKGKGNRKVQRKMLDKEVVATETSGLLWGILMLRDPSVLQLGAHPVHILPH